MESWIVVRKYGLLNGSDLDEFSDFCKELHRFLGGRLPVIPLQELAEKVSQHRAAFDEA